MQEISAHLNLGARRALERDNLLSFLNDLTRRTFLAVVRSLSYELSFFYHIFSSPRGPSRFPLKALRASAAYKRLNYRGKLDPGRFPPLSPHSVPALGTMKNKTKISVGKKRKEKRKTGKKRTASNPPILLVRGDIDASLGSFIWDQRVKLPMKIGLRWHFRFQWLPGYYLPCDQCLCIVSCLVRTRKSGDFVSIWDFPARLTIEQIPEYGDALMYSDLSNYWKKVQKCANIQILWAQSRNLVPLPFRRKNGLTYFGRASIHKILHAYLRYFPILSSSRRALK